MSITSGWPYLLRLALASYFFANHFPSLFKAINMLSGKSNTNSIDNIFTCASSYVSPQISFFIWHLGFVLLGLLILFWPRPISFLSIALIILFMELYINYSKNLYGTSSLLIIISILIAIVLLIIYGMRKRY